jgi:hypothetical protein
MIGELRRREIGFCSLHERLDTTTPGGRLVFHVFAALAEFIRELIVSGTREGLDAACGRVGGRPTVATPEIISPGTLHNHIPDLWELRASGRIPEQLTSSWPFRHKPALPLVLPGPAWRCRLRWTAPTIILTARPMITRSVTICPVTNSLAGSVLAVRQIPDSTHPQRETHTVVITPPLLTDMS